MGAGDPRAEETIPSKGPEDLLRTDHKPEKVDAEGRFTALIPRAQKAAVTVACRGLLWGEYSTGSEVASDPAAGGTLGLKQYI